MLDDKTPFSIVFYILVLLGEQQDVKMWDRNNTHIDAPNKQQKKGEKQWIYIEVAFYAEDVIFSFENREEKFGIVIDDFGTAWCKLSIFPWDRGLIYDHEKVQR